MKIVFFGTPDYVLPVVEQIHKKIKRKKRSPGGGGGTEHPKTERGGEKNNREFGKIQFSSR